MSDIIDFRGIVEDMYLLDFYERKYNKIFIIGSDELTILGEYYKDKIFMSKAPYTTKDLSSIIEETLKKDYPELFEILTLCEGKLSIYGSSLIDILFEPNTNFTRIKLCWHSCTIEEAKILLSKCLDVFAENIYYNNNNNNVIVTTGTITFEFPSIIYRDREELLRNIGNTGVKYGYDLIAKYFTTVNAAITTATRMCPLDVSFNRANIFDCDYQGISFVFHGDNKSMINSDFSPHINVRSYDRNILFRLNNIAPYEGDTDYEREVDAKIEEISKEVNINLTLYKEIPYKKFDPRIRFGKDYIPIVIGISGDRYTALSGIRKKFKLDDDIFRILCDTWLREEVLDAKNRLLK